MQNKLCAVFLSVVLLTLATPAFACDSPNVPDSTNDFAGSALNDFARIMHDAQVPGCASAAASKLSAKLSLMSVSKWQSTWSGGALSMVLATGLILGAQGQLSSSLDLQIAKAANDWKLVLQTNGDGSECGFRYGTWVNGNTCLEDYAIATQAQGWRAAYYRLTGREWLATRSSAVTYMRTTINDQINCIVDPDIAPDVNDRGPCKGSPDQLGDGFTWDGLPQNATVVTINHSFQNPAYGLGQMTAVAVGAVGLEVAKEPFRRVEIYDPNKAIANFLWREANEKANSDGSFNQVTCFSLNTSNATLGSPLVGCWDAQKTQMNGYRADMFPVAQFYIDYGLSRSLKPGTSVRWAFDSFNSAPFTDVNGFYGAGRYESYYTMPFRWLDSQHGRPEMHGRNEYYAGIKRISYYVTNTGTGTPMATATSRPLTNGVGAADRSFTIVDLNGGDLLTGDPVAIRNQDGWYWQAANGGGSTVASNAISATGAARFTIVKISADAGDPIAHNDLFSLKTSDGVHYLVAPQTGGAVSATSTSIITDEQFRLERWKTE